MPKCLKCGSTSTHNIEKSIKTKGCYTYLKRHYVADAREISLKVFGRNATSSCHASMKVLRCLGLVEVEKSKPCQPQIYRLIQK